MEGLSYMWVLRPMAVAVCDGMEGPGTGEGQSRPLYVQDGQLRGEGAWRGLRARGGVGRAGGQTREEGTDALGQGWAYWGQGQALVVLGPPATKSTSS